MKRSLLFLGVLTILLIAGCDLLPIVSDEDNDDSYGQSPSPTSSQTESIPIIPIASEQEQPKASSPTQNPENITADKWLLWVNGPHLRGANVWQAVVIPDLDGLEFKGPGPFGPPYTQGDFDRLAALGANYVSISGPGLFTETPPFEINQDAVENLDNLLAMIAKADMFATISARTGPGRSEFGLCCDGEGEFGKYTNDSMWEDQTAQDAWVAMWRYTAERYKDNPIVAGYKLMVEPNANGIFFDIYEGDQFYPEYTDTLYDWNQLYPRIVEGIRQVDAQTPILVGGMSWSGVNWLPYLQTVADPRIVYVVHQYEPQEGYTHQEPDGRNAYPGVFDTDYDGEDDLFDRGWLDDFLSPVDEFMALHDLPVAVDEFGVMRWVPGAANFMADQIALFEARGLNYALWEWSLAWAPFAEEVHAFNFRLGPDADNITEVDNALKAVITSYWSRNTVRPSSWAAGAEDAVAAPEDLQSSAWWQPSLDTTWQWQLDGALDLSFDVGMYDLDLFETEASIVQSLKAQGRAVICYISVGSWEDWRPDADQFPPEVIGNAYQGWPGERWLDIRQIELLAPIMRARLDQCATKGFDGVEPDNIEGYLNETGFPLTYEDQLTYNIWLAEEAHTRGLSIGLKNDPEQIADLLPYYDWALTEECFIYGWCEEMLPFIEAGKPVFMAEYLETGIGLDDICPLANSLRLNALLKNLDLDAYAATCP